MSFYDAIFLLVRRGYYPPVLYRHGRRRFRTGASFLSEKLVVDQ